MNLINEKYKIISTIDENSFISSFRVNDLELENKELRLVILNVEYIDEEIINLYRSDFVNFASIRNQNILKNIDFGIINTIDGTKISEKKYYYTSELIKEEDISSLIEKKGTLSIIDIFIQISKAIYYLNKRGIYYDEITLENILLTDANGYDKIYLRDLATVRLNSYLNSKNESIPYTIPELSESDNEQIEIYSIGTLLENIVKYKKKQGLEIDGRIYRLIDKLKSSSISNMYSSLYEFVQDINEVFNLDYELVDKDDFYELDFETKIIGRNQEIKEVIEAYRKIKEGKKKTSFINILGGLGMGKSKFLSEVMKQLSFEKAHIYTNIKNEKENLFSFIIKNMMNTVETIDPENHLELLKYSKGNKFKSDDLKALEKIGSFILKNIEPDGSVFILDDIDKADDFSVELLKYMLHENRNRKKFLIIGSSENECDKNIFTESTKIYMKNLTLKESNAYIQNLLKSKISMGNFSTIIYKETYGNPRRIKDIIRSLKDRSLIYIDERHGTWETDFDQEYLFSIEKLDENIINTMEKLDDKSKEIMNVMSLFNSPITYDVIEKMIGKYENKIIESIKKLTSMGFIQKKVEDAGYVYDISSKSLRSQIYNNMDELIKRKRHRRAAILLEDEYKQNKRHLEEELIYHFEKAELKNKLLEYAIISGEKFMDLNLRLESIEMFEKAYNIIKDKQLYNKKIYIIKKLGFLYLMEGNIMKSIYFYEEAYEFAIKNDDKDLVIDFLNKIVSLYMIKDRYEYAEIYVHMLEKLVKEKDYKKGYIQFSCNKARYHIMRNEYDKAKEDLNNITPYLEDAPPREKGNVYDLLGNIYLEESNIKEALRYKHKSKHFYREGNNMWGLSDVLTDIGDIYLEFNQDHELALKYYSVSLNLSEKYGTEYAKIKSYYTIGRFHMYNINYDESLKYLQKALHMAKKIKMEKYVLRCYLSISKIYFDKNMYEMGSKYYELSVEEFPKNIRNNMENGEFYLLSATIELIRGNIQKAREKIELALSFFKRYNFKRTWNAKIIKKYIELYGLDLKNSVIDKNKILSETQVLIEKFKNPLEKIDLYYHLISTSVSIGERDVALHNLAKFIENARGTKNLHISGKKAYLLGLFEDGIEKEEYLKEAIEISNQLENERSYWHANILLGDYYFEMGKIFQGLNYYLEGALVIEEIIKSIKEGYLENFVDIKNIKDTLYKLKIIKEMNSQLKITDIDLNTEEVEKINILDYDRIVNRSFVQTLLKNKELIKEMDSDSIKTRYQLKQKWDIVQNLHYDSLDNIDLILEYILDYSFGTKGMVLINDENSNLVPISKIGTDIQLSYDKQRIIDKAKRLGKPVIMNIVDDKDEFKKGRLPHGIRAVFCAPIRLKFRRLEKDKRKTLDDKYKDVGFIYIEASKTLNNFNNSLVEEIQSINNILGILIQNYNYKTYSFLDKLTGAYNRKYMEERVLSKISSLDEESAIIIMDLDNFKKINDTYGHQFGDEILAKFAEIVKTSIRQGDIFCRYGGEEFLLFIPKTSKQIAIDVAERIRTSIEENLTHSGMESTVTASMGVSVYPYDGIHHNELINKADKALYVAKKTGKNKVVVWSDEFKDQQIERKADFLLEDSREINKKLLGIVSILESIRDEKKLSSRIFVFLKEVMEQLNAEEGYIFLVENDFKIAQTYKRDAKVDINYEQIQDKEYNKYFVDRAIKDKKGFYQIDWDNIVSRDSYTGMPNWNSIISEPIIANGDLVGVIYMSSDRRKKEFDENDLRFLSITSSLIGNIIKSQ